MCKIVCLIRTRDGASLIRGFLIAQAFDTQGWARDGRVFHTHRRNRPQTRQVYPYAQGKSIVLLHCRVAHVEYSDQIEPEDPVHGWQLWINQNHPEDHHREPEFNRRLHVLPDDNH